MKIFFCVLLCLLMFTGCHRKAESALPVPVETVRAETIRSIRPEYIRLDSIASSFLGHLDMRADTIYFIDSRFCWVFRFDKDGILIDRKLGYGRGPGEISSGIIDGYCKLPGGWFFVGSANDCYIYDRELNNNIRTYMIDRGKSNEISTENPLRYGLLYLNLIMKSYDGHIYYIVRNNDRDSFYDKTYFRDVHFLSRMNASNGTVTGLLGRYPPLYYQVKDNHLMMYRFPFFDLDREGNFYIGFEADSMIYCYDREFQPKYAFGFQGKKMRTNYPNVHTVDELRYKRTNEKQKYGHYNSVKYIDETGLLFRTYAKGSHYRWDGLQIYNGTTLMGDVEVPKNFRIIGYYDDYYYASCGIDEEKEIITICKFKL